MKNEYLYYKVMKLAQKLLLKELISKEEYQEINTMFTVKYQPSLCTLFADISLLNPEIYENMSHDKEAVDEYSCKNGA